MISLKKFLDERTPSAIALPSPAIPVAKDVTVKPDPGISAEIKRGTDPGTKAWLTLLQSAGDAAAMAIPPLGPALNLRLSVLRRTYTAAPGAEVLNAIGESLCTEFTGWSQEAAKFYSDHQEELKEITSAVARTAEAIGERDDRYATEIGGFATRLRSVAEQNDIAVIRKSIMESTGAVHACVTRMAKEGRETVRQLSAQTEEYRRRMEAAERISLVDPLTGVLNRRGLDRELQRRMGEGRPFFLTMMDLDKFKAVNDRFGHAAGDDLLRQLGSELLSHIPAPDTAARLGGDEFVVVSSGPESGAEALTTKIRSWVLGKYRVSDGNNGKVEVMADASLGTTPWDGRETADVLMARADAHMYKAKKRQREEGNSRAAVSEPELAGAER